MGGRHWRSSKCRIATFTRPRGSLGPGYDYLVEPPPVVEVPNKKRNWKTPLILAAVLLVVAAGVGTGIVLRVYMSLVREIEQLSKGGVP